MSSKDKPKKRKSIFRFFLYDFVKITGALGAYIWIKPRIHYVSDEAKRAAYKDGGIVIANHTGVTDPIKLEWAFWNRRFHMLAFKELFDAYYNSLYVLMQNDLHSISFPLISSGIFGGSLADPVGESTKQCCRAYNKFISDYPNYNVDVKLCAFTLTSMQEAQPVFDSYFKN